jgi:hypothetical protein
MIAVARPLSFGGRVDYDDINIVEPTVKEVQWVIAEGRVRRPADN